MQQVYGLRVCKSKGVLTKSTHPKAGRTPKNMNHLPLTRPLSRLWSSTPSRAQTENSEQRSGR